MTRNTNCSGEWYFAVQGDTLELIGRRFGLAVGAILGHPHNKELVDSGRTVTVLAPGDYIFIPSTRIQVLALPTQARHRLVRRRVQRWIKVQFVDDEKLLASTPFTLTCDSGDVRNGISDAEGYVEQDIPPSARTVNIDFSTRDGMRSFTFLVGHLDPVTEESGIIQRLTNLGYLTRTENPDRNVHVVPAIRRFQREHRLSDSGDADNSTQSVLVQVHGQ